MGNIEQAISRDWRALALEGKRPDRLDTRIVLRQLARRLAQEDGSGLGGFLQSRNYKAAGLYVYEYRIDLRDAVGAHGITTLTIDVGPNAKFDFNGDGHKDDVFVTTKGNLGNVGLQSAVRSGGRVTFTFQQPCAGGSGPGRGDSTFFFGLVSKYPRHNVTASAVGLGGAPLLLDAWAPSYR